MEFLFLLMVLCILWLYCRDLLPGAKRRWNSRISSSSTFCSVGPSSVGLSHSRGLSGRDYRGSSPAAAPRRASFVCFYFSTRFRIGVPCAIRNGVEAFISSSIPAA